MGFLVFQHAVLGRWLISSLDRKISTFSFCWEHAFSPVLTVCTIPSAHPFDWGSYGGVLYGLHPFFSDHKLRSSSQNFGALSDTRVFGMPFLENMTLRICFIVELFLSGARITSGQPEKESTSINKSPTSVIYAWSICTRLHGSTSLGPWMFSIFCVKFLSSSHFLHLFIYSSSSREYPGCHASNFILFCVADTPQWISSCILFITNFLRVSKGIIRSPLQITSCSIVN